MRPTLEPCESKVLLSTVSVSPVPPSPGPVELFTATLTPESGVTTRGTATGVLLLNTATDQVGAVISYRDLTGTPTAVHLHGPGPGGEVTFEFTGIPSGATGLVASAFQLSPAQVGDLQAGRDFFEIHTPSFPDGELSGTLTHRE